MGEEHEQNRELELEVEPHRASLVRTCVCVCGYLLQSLVSLFVAIVCCVR